MDTKTKAEALNAPETTRQTRRKKNKRGSHTTQKKGQVRA